MKNVEHTADTVLLDYHHQDIQNLVAERKWRGMPDYEAIGRIYNFVRDEIKFGYNKSDSIPASDVLKDGYGQCNTKAVLLMALMRCVGIPTRFRGFTIDKSLQRGVVPEIIYSITPENIIHSWVEVFYDGNWIILEGFILDKKYLSALQRAFGNHTNFCGYGVGTLELQNPKVDWNGSDTYIQNTAINQDFGLFDSPDEFYSQYAQEFSPWKKILYVNVIRHWMNKRVQKIRLGGKVSASVVNTCSSKLLSLESLNVPSLKRVSR